MRRSSYFFAAAISMLRRAYRAKERLAELSAKRWLAFPVSARGRLNSASSCVPAQARAFRAPAISLRQKRTIDVLIVLLDACLLAIPIAVDYAAGTDLMKETITKLNIRYLGFETTVGGGRRLDFSVTSPGKTPTRATINVPSCAFNGTNRISFQETAALCYEKLRDVIERELFQEALLLSLTDQDILEFRPRGRRAAVRK
jgi:hypothetical protein